MNDLVKPGDTEQHKGAQKLIPLIIETDLSSKVIKI